MRVEQYVMAYGTEQDRIRAILSDGFISIRPVVRINAEIRDDKYGYTVVTEKQKKAMEEAGVDYTYNSVYELTYAAVKKMLK